MIKILNSQNSWLRLLWVMPLAMSVTVGLLLWMVKMTWLDASHIEEVKPQVAFDFIIKEPNIETFIAPPVKPKEPMPTPKTFDVVKTLKIDENALNMRPEIKTARFKAPKLVISSNFSHMGLGQRQVLGSRAKPSYPREAKNAQVEGTVYLEFDISKRGIPRNIRILESQPEGVFDVAAINAVKKWRYARKFSNGEAIETPNFRNRVNFRLDEMNLASAQ